MTSYRGPTGDDSVRQTRQNNTANARRPYTLRPEVNEQSVSMQQMLEVQPPSHGVLGGVAQSHNDAPVQFYRFTKERKQNMEKAMYQNPFNPLTDDD